MLLFVAVILKRTEKVQTNANGVRKALPTTEIAHGVAGRER